MAPRSDENARPTMKFPAQNNGGSNNTMYGQERAINQPDDDISHEWE